MKSPDSVMVIEDLVSAESLGVSVLAGAEGLSREVLWAHSCELEAPERWLAPHELLMTVGLCIPKTPAEQLDFIRRLDEAGLAGVMIGDHDLAPPISQDMLTEADARGFPILLVTEETPYAVVARHVAAASSSSQLLQVLKLSKLYQIAASSDDDPNTLVVELARLLRADLQVVDQPTGIVMLQSTRIQPDAETRQPRSYPLRGRYLADLVLYEYPDEPVESFILVHLLKVLEIAVDRVLTEVAARVMDASSALESMLAGTPSPATERLLGGESIAHGFQIAAFNSQSADRIARSVALQNLPVLVGPGRSSHVALVPQAHVDGMRGLAESLGVKFGVSSMFTDYRDVRIAAEEANRVLSASQHSEQVWSEFQGSTIAVLARSRKEAEEIISGVLGPLATETSAMQKLRETLFTFLRLDRNWKRTADELGIHRQTLAYRLNRIEEETGLKASHTADLSALWVAYQAWEGTRAGGLD